VPLDPERGACVVIHQDDVGMCHGANLAFVELSRLGAITSGSVMAPCPWFPEIAEAVGDDPRFDLGVHLTLTAEKRHYRWGPVAPLTTASGLLDPDGYLWRSVAEVRHHAHIEAVEEECRAQINRALDAGIDVTHLDAHMGAMLAPQFINLYVQLGIDYRVPVLITTELAGYSPREPHLRGATDADFDPARDRAAEAGIPLFDVVLETDFSRRASAYGDTAERLFDRISDGLTFMALHPNAPGEVECIEPDQYHVRTQEHAHFRSAEHLTWLAQQPFHPTGMRTFRNAMRSFVTVG
jgi:chitin disaccharide deacetylase